MKLLRATRLRTISQPVKSYFFCSFRISHRKIRQIYNDLVIFSRTCNGIKELIPILDSAVSVAMNLDNFSFISRNKEIKRMHKTNAICFCMLSIFSGKCSTIVLDDIDKIFYCWYKKSWANKQNMRYEWRMQFPL